MRWEDGQRRSGRSMPRKRPSCISYLHIPSRWCDTNMLMVSQGQCMAYSGALAASWYAALPGLRFEERMVSTYQGIRSRGYKAQQPHEHNRRQSNRAKAPHSHVGRPPTGLYLFCTDTSRHLALVSRRCLALANKCCRVPAIHERWEPR